MDLISNCYENFYKGHKHNVKSMCLLSTFPLLTVSFRVWGWIMTMASLIYSVKFNLLVPQAISLHSSLLKLRLQVYTLPRKFDIVPGGLQLKSTLLTLGVSLLVSGQVLQPYETPQHSPWALPAFHSSGPLLRLVSALGMLFPLFSRYGTCVASEWICFYTIIAPTVNNKINFKPLVWLRENVMHEKRLEV